ncbi:hypothetical protein VTL71DRAFT_15782 [Oculimacula yallundae]|uniref:Uncharacterized protein n=1 Tax=Oculimacula yallundae TaxID=86028 RepID=A0ABR4CE07_9HELO
MSSSPNSTNQPLALRTPCWEVVELNHPDHLECYSCKKLHLMENILSHPDGWTKCRKGPNLRMATFIHPTFDLTIFRTIMKLERQNKLQGHDLELLAYRGRAVLEHSQVKRLIVEPKIVGGTLLMRSEVTYVVPPTAGPNQTLLLRRNLFKCPHSTRWKEENRRALKLLQGKFEMLESIPSGHHEHILSYRCKFCPTEFDVGLQRFDGQGVVLFIVKWQDIGTGLSPLGDDLPPIIGHYPLIRTPQKPVKLDYKSPRARFEGFAQTEGQTKSPAGLATQGVESLFTLQRSWQAKLRRHQTKVFWPLSKEVCSFPLRDWLSLDMLKDCK